MLSLLFFWAAHLSAAASNHISRTGGPSMLMSTTLNISLYGHMKAELVPQILDSADKYNSV